MSDVIDDVVIRFKKNEPLDLLDLSQSLVFLSKAEARIVRHDP